MREKKPIRLSGHHLAMLGEYFDGRNIDFEEYGKDFINKVKGIYQEIINKSTIVELGEGIDDICHICPIRTQKCEIDSSKGDMENIIGYKLEKGKHSSKEIIKKIKEFKKRTLWGSPRAEKYFLVY
jgi:hypothetical protein